MPDSTPIPSASVLARAVETSRENYDKAFQAGVKAACAEILDCEREECRELIAMTIANKWDEENRRKAKAYRAAAIADVFKKVRALCRDTPDAG